MSPTLRDHHDEQGALHDVLLAGRASATPFLAGMHR